MKLKDSKRPAKSGRKTVTSAPPPIIRKILAPTDFSDASRYGVGYAVALAERLGAAVSLLHVIEPRTWLSELGSVGPVREDAEVLASARAQLAAMAKREGKGEVAVTCSVSVRAGNPFDAIATAAREQTTELIVLATHGHKGFERVLLGSTAERVVRHAPCPVLTVPPRAKPKRAGRTPTFKLKTILVPIDFSNLSKDALPYAVLMAKQFGAEVILLHVVEKLPIDYLLGPRLTHDAVGFLMKQAEAGLERIAGHLRKSTGVKSSAAVLDGWACEAICSAAEALRADLILLTTHGHTGLKHVWLGSTAEQVVRHSPCPVLVVRDLQRKPR